MINIENVIGENTMTQSKLTIYPWIRKNNLRINLRTIKKKMIFDKIHLY